MEKPTVLKNGRGKQLVGILHLPVGKKKTPLLVIAEGFDGNKSARKFVDLARVLEKKGIAVFRFDFAGYGDSEGDLSGVTIKSQVSDLDLVMRHLFRISNIDRNKVAFLGYSMGSVVVSIFTVKNRFPVKTIVFWAPAFQQKDLIKMWNTKSEIRDWKKHGYLIKKDKKMGRAYLSENENRDYSEILRKITAPILVLHGERDDTIPLKFVRKLLKYNENIKLNIIPRGEHDFEDYFVSKELIGKTAKWLDSSATSPNL